ncbi:MAG: FAD-binding protein [Saprospiraceae bacterium]|nr:FAD-binding protein [Saprospiraceae bacterium]
MTKPYVGYRPDDMSSEYGVFFHPGMADLSESVKKALNGTLAENATIPAFSAVSDLENEGYQSVETGYTLAKDGSIAIAVHTHMPGVTPAMWHWWFGWHGSQDRRYKLWHPGAHMSARWEDGRTDSCYVGRNSIVREIIGNKPLDALIQFKSPLEFGFSSEAVNRPDKAVYICARLGHPEIPVDMGYLVHQVRAVAGGCEMRSRFWLGGKYVRLRRKGKLADLAAGVLQQFRLLPANFGADMLRHCAEEMRHLAGILPDLHQKWGADDTCAISGAQKRRTEPDFDKKMMSTLFNKVDPGQRPAMILEPNTVEDIIHIVRYAQKVGKRITISSGGHSFSANFIREDSILILMKNFNRYEVNKETMTAKAGPGVGGSVLMKALFRENLFFPAGHCKGVCIGGYLLQGGYGWNGRKLGIACQSVIGMDIVTASGELVYADARHNADLFWAARGSGPGFFGIVVNFYLKLYPLPPYRAIIAHDFAIKHLEDVYRWAWESGASVPKAIEFQMIMSKNMLNLLGPGIEAFAPIFADTREEFEEAKAFMHNSPVRKKAVIATPAINPGIEMLYKSAMTHYPSNYHWGVDNMWTHAAMDDLLPFIREIAATLPPPPSHFLWLNWHPGSLGADMAYSKEDQIYMALYSCWKNAKDTPVYGDWASNMMRKMQHLGVGIQLADEALHKRTASFMTDENLQRVQRIRAERDPAGLFYEWHSWQK